MKKFILLNMILISLFSYFVFANNIPSETDRQYKIKSYITGDNAYELYINGELIGTTVGDVWDWSSAEDYLTPLNLGKNVIAVKVINKGGPGGLFGEFFYPDKSFITNNQWKYNFDEEEGWETLNFDDSQWKNALEYGDYGTFPWTKVLGFETDKPAAKWIWGDYNNYPDYIYRGDEEIYFRYVFDFDKPTKLVNPKISIDASRMKGSAPLKIVFEGEGYDLDGEIVEYNWDFGNGDFSNQKIVEYVYNESGLYDVRFTAKDNNENTLTISKTIKVMEEGFNQRFKDNFDLIDDNRWDVDDSVYQKDGILYIPIGNKIESKDNYKHVKVTAKFNNPGQTGYDYVPFERNNERYQWHALKFYIDDNNFIFINTQRYKVHVAAKKDGKLTYTQGGIKENIRGFHEYGIDWKPNKIDFFLDGELIYTINDNIIDDFASIQLVTSQDEFSEPMELDYVVVGNLDEIETMREENEIEQLVENLGKMENQKNFIESQCNGCLDANDNCIPISVRIGNLYCDIDKNFKDQLRGNAYCNNNYECSSNLCIDNQCIESGLFQKVFNWFKRVFG